MPGDPNNLFGGPLPEGPPEDPAPSPLQTDAIGLHVMFGSLLAAGFTELQACTILGTAIGVQSGGKK